MDERRTRTPEPSHLAPEMLADLLSGEIEGDDLRRRVIPHLLQRCPVCRRRVEGIRRLQERFDHWNESVVVREGQEAPRLLAKLMELPEEARFRRLSSEESFHTWGLNQLLLQQSRERAHSEPRQAVELAELAVEVVDHLPTEPYHPEWVGDLKARSWAVLGNARRVVGELVSAEAAFRRALALLEGKSTGRPQVRAEVVDLLASLRREQGRLAEALSLLDEMESLYRRAGDDHMVGKSLLKRAVTLHEKGDTHRAVEILGRATSLLDPARQAQLPLFARQHLVCYLIALERFPEARERLIELSSSYDWKEPQRQRLRWAEAQIAQGLEEWETAETLYLELQTWFLNHDLPFDAALVSLDLALLYKETDRDEELQRLASQILPLFQTRGVGREALASLLLFQQALERKTLTAELLREMRDIVRRRRPERR
jgi:tetratricopeptide (TPR) repeat protein